jgi:hypothetical protein
MIKLINFTFIFFISYFIILSEGHAKITRIEILKIEPAFNGEVFGSIGSYERVIGKAYGEVDPKQARNAQIQDLNLAAKNTRGLVEYSTDIEILRPTNSTKANGTLFFNITNRGNKGGLSLINADIPNALSDVNAVKSAGDGYMQRQGYTLIWFGWQADVLPGNNRMLLNVPIAKNKDGSEITGIVRSEIFSPTPTTTLNLSSGWFTSLIISAYPTANIDNKVIYPDGFKPTLTQRERESGLRAEIPNNEWSFASCQGSTEPKPSETQICYPAGFKSNRIYELIYKAKNPLVMGLGFAVARDLGSFLKNNKKDSAGQINPAYLPNAKTLVMGSSQSGRFIRSMIMLGFNQDENGRRVFDGALPHIGGGLMPLNIRFAQPGRAAGTETFDRLFPGTEFPFAYSKMKDPLTGRNQGILDTCLATASCPKIVHAATALEVWELRQSLGFTDPLGMKDLAEMPDVRSYIMASTQHSSASMPLPKQQPFAACQQQANPNPHTWTMRALLSHLNNWVQKGIEPPPSARPTISSGTLVKPDVLNFPRIPANQYGGVTRSAVRYTANNNPLHVQDYGNSFHADKTSGVLSIEPPKLSSATYGNLVAQVDADGNDLGGIRNIYVSVPIGTYTGWNLFNSNFPEDGFCTLQGSFIPFAQTKQERLNSGDPRLSLEERYPTKEAYINSIKNAAEKLIKDGFLLEQDAERLIKEATTNGLRQGP